MLTWCGRGLLRAGVGPLPTQQTERSELPGPWRNCTVVCVCGVVGGGGIGAVCWGVWGTGLPETPRKHPAALKLSLSPGRAGSWREAGGETLHVGPAPPSGSAPPQLLGLFVASMAALTYFGAHFAVIGHASPEDTPYEAMHHWRK